MQEATRINSLKKIEDFSKKIRKNILNMAYSAGSSSAHIGGALSIADIVSLLFVHKMKIISKNPVIKILKNAFVYLSFNALLENSLLNKPIKKIIKEKINIK